ncbi:MAG: hypothetical protein GDA68_21440, partial [Nitrospira sp. CR2.1]|nr:hypothetical protein [Nitrospira sp. CR2.1]
MRYRKAAGVLAGAAVAVGSMISPWMLVHAERAAAPERGGVDSAIERTKEKGLDGVDFSYDLFGGPPGPSATQLAEQAVAKDRKDKPKVMAQQAKRLQERYRLDCTTSSSSKMTKGKPQPLGPTVKLKDGLTWDALGRMDAEDMRRQKAFPQGFMRLPHVKHDVGGMVFPQEQ